MKTTSSSPLLPSRCNTLVLHLTYLIFLFLTVLLVSLGHLPSLTSYKSLAITLFSLPALSTQILELTSRLIPFIYTFRWQLKTHLYQAAFNTS